MKQGEEWTRHSLTPQQHREALLRPNNVLQTTSYFLFISFHPHHPSQPTTLKDRTSGQHDGLFKPLEEVNSSQGVAEGLPVTSVQRLNS
ncbi:hypothetical protein E2C01_041592 [Portunus trituberculatus]|uniref:Uncharacterized protein n=1 Tax=Portunus trituberculatus TaxID=210409 RepID=A0A5B7FU48_PORTR|nr:hypothetical protein [Portunus trituberculatus]